MARHIVATVDEIPPGERKIVEIEGRSIGVFNIAGTFYALRNQCPHQGGPLCEGYLSGFLEATVPGAYKYSRRGEILRCPWHGWEYDVKTGQSWVDPKRVRTRSYQVDVASGASLDDQTTCSADMKKGPYVAERYDVSIDQEYVVVEMTSYS